MTEFDLVQEAIRKGLLPKDFVYRAMTALVRLSGFHGTILVHGARKDDVVCRAVSDARGLRLEKP